MKTVIVFESMFGNTAKFAREIAGGLASASTQVALADVRQVRQEDLQGCDLLVVGAPTHAFSLSRPSTRADAVQRGAESSRALLGVREWLATLDEGFPLGAARPAVAVFDSRVAKVKHLPGSAARGAARILDAKGFEVLGDPASFYVVDVMGPPAPGECARARDWAGRLAELMGSRSSRSTAS